MTITQNLNNLLQDIDNLCRTAQRKKEEVFLVAISKNASYEALLEAYHSGCRDFGENRVNEALTKMEKAPSDIRWHFIGKLQTNKVVKVIGRFSLIHSVDNLKLAEKISVASTRLGLKTSILLEVNTSGEVSKGGLSREEWKRCFPLVLALKGINVCGLMTMAPMTEDESIIRRTFSDLRYFRDELQTEMGCVLEILSMGMSNDYAIAIQEGATLLRIGSKIFSST